MKQILLILGFVFLITSVVLAQKTITKEEFDHLVDYANCLYVKTFIENNESDYYKNKDNYVKKVKPELDLVSLDNFQTILKFDKITNLLDDYPEAQDLAQKINDRKKNYDQFQDNESLINSLSAVEWGKVALRKISSQIQTDLRNKYRIDASNETNTLKKAVEDLQLKTYELQEEFDGFKENETITEFKNLVSKMRKFLYYGFGVIAVLFVIFFLVLISRTSRDYIINHVFHSKRIEDKLTLRENAAFNKVTTHLIKNSQPYKLTESDINIIVDKVYRYIKSEELSKDKRNNSTIDIPVTIIAAKPDISYRYLKGKTGNIFNRTESTPDNSYFRLFHEKDEFAQFEFFGDEREAIAKMIFNDDICTIISGSYQNAKNVINLRPGKVERISEQWKVVEKAQIKLI